ncbi:MAG: hypothetical protein NWF00_08160 [Candidatus Bathyarchaeota archaeon]|nr:hypothetical protein [Candidatus Bathyarchaeota archaeon]
MAKDEGLCSSKAITFIQRKGSLNDFRLGTKIYFTIGISRIQNAACFLKTRNRVVNRLNVMLMKNLGDQKWIK